MAALQPRNAFKPAAATERPVPIAARPRQRTKLQRDPLAVVAVLVPALAAGFILGRKLLRRGRRSPASSPATANALPEGAALVSGGVDSLGLETAPPLSAAGPEPLPLELFDEHIQCSVQHLFRLIMGPDAVFIGAQHSKHEYWDVIVGDWAALADGRIVRRICFTTPLRATIGPKQAECIEEYCIAARSADGFHVAMSATTPNVPYGSAFFQDIQFVARSTGPGGCRLSVTAEVKFTKRVLALGGIIRSSAAKGMKETYSTYMDSIQEALRQRPDPEQNGGLTGGASRYGGASPAAATPPAAAAVGAACGKQAPAAMLGSPLARQLWERWFRDVTAAALLIASLWLMRRAVEGAAAAVGSELGSSVAVGGSGGANGFWRGRRVSFPAGSAWPQLQAVPGAV